MAGWNLEETGILVCVQCAQRWTEPDRSRSVTDAPVVQIMGSFSLFMSQRRRGNLTSPMQQRATPMTMHPISCDVTDEAKISLSIQVMRIAASKACCGRIWERGL